MFIVKSSKGSPYTVRLEQGKEQVDIQLSMEHDPYRVVGGFYVGAYGEPRLRILEDTLGDMGIELEIV